MTKQLLGLVFVLTLLAPPALAEEADEEGAMSLEEISRMLDNPLGNLWIIFIENDVLRFRGKPANGWKTINVLSIQPILPVPLTENWNLVTRPIIPIVSAPKFNAPNFGDCPGNCNSRPAGARLSSDRETDLGANSDSHLR